MGTAASGCRLIARKYGLYGNSIKDAAMIDMVMDGVEVRAAATRHACAASGSSWHAPAPLSPCLWRLLMTAHAQGVLSCVIAVLLLCN